MFLFKNRLPVFKSKQINRYFAECFGLNIQTFADEDLFRYYLSLYSVEDKYIEFYDYVKNNFLSPDDYLHHKNEVIFSVIKELMFHVRFQVFNMINFDQLFKDLSPLRKEKFLYPAMMNTKTYNKFLSVIDNDRDLNSIMNDVITHFEKFNFGDRKVDEKCNLIRNHLVNQTKFNDIMNNSDILRSFFSENQQIFSEYIQLESILNTFPVRKSIYHSDFIGNNIVSIDLKKANYQILRKLQITTDQPYNDFMSIFCGSDIYLPNNKDARQVLFGNLAKSRVLPIEEVLMKDLGYTLQEKLEREDFDNMDVDLFKVISHNSGDEIIIDCGKKLIDLETILFEIKLKDLISELDQDIDLNIRSYILKSIKTNQGEFFYKDSSSSKELKCVPAYLYPQIYKIVHGKKISDKDLIFEESTTKQLCKFLNKITIK